MLSAKGRDVEVTKGIAVGADAYVTKPFSTQDLIAKVARAAGRIARCRDKLAVRAGARARRGGCVLAAIVGASRCSSRRDLPERGARGARCAILRDARRRASSSAALLLLAAARARRARAVAPLRRRRRAQLAEDARIMLAANPAHRAPPRGAAEIARLAGGAQRLRRRARSAAAATSRRAGARGERAHRAGAQPPRGADVGARAERARVQHRGPHPALQRARDAAPAQAARRRRRRRQGAHAWSASGARSSRSSTATSSSTRSRASTTGCAQGARSPVANFVTDRARRASSCACSWRRCSARRPRRRGRRADGIAGFVLLLDNITRRIESGQPPRPAAADADAGHARVARQHARRGGDHRVVSRTWTRTAQDRFIGIIGEEARSLSARLDQTVGEFADSLRTEWPLEDMRGADLIAAARRRIETQPRAADQARGRRRVDLAQRRQLFADAGRSPTSSRRLRDEFGIREIRFGLEARGPLAHLDLIWTGAPLGFETHDGVADRLDGAGRRGVPAHAEADRRAPRRARSGTRSTSRAARVLPHRDPA